MTPYDPLSRQRLLNALMTFMYAPVAAKIIKRKEQLVIQNAIRTSTGHKSIMYKGELSNFDTEKLPRPVARLLPTLVGEWENILLEEREVFTERTVVEGAVIRILNKLVDLRDCFKIFPASMHHVLNPLIAFWAHPIGKALDDAAIQELIQDNEEYLMKMRIRLGTNLII